MYLPARARKRNTSDKGIVEVCNIDPEVVKRHAFRPGLISQTLYRVQLLQRRIPGTIHESKDEDERNHCLRLARPLHQWRPVGIRHIAAVGFLL